MKKLRILFFSSLILTVSCSEDRDSENKEKSFKQPQTACECQDRSDALIEANIAGENIAKEEEKLHKACKALMDKIGEAVYMDQINICNEERGVTDSASMVIELDTALAMSVTPCECKSQITELMNRGGAGGENVQAEIDAIDRTCGELRKYMGELEYLNALNECP